MATFGDFETIGEPISVSEQSGHVTTVWRAHKTGTDSSPTHAIKVFAPHRRKGTEGEAEDALDKDRGLEFLEGVKQIKKVQMEGGRYLTPIHAFGFSDEGAWYVTDFYPRNTLKAWIARRGSVDGPALSQVVHCIVTGCLALKESRGYSHGNLKAANVFLVGKPQPLRKTPLALADAYPSAPLQLGRLVGEEKHTVDDLLHQVMEVQDLRALGELLLQLVEGRLVSSAYDYNYPVAASPAWERLGRDAERWRNLTNQLLDPRLSLEKVSLESLAREFKPSGLTPHLPKILVGAGAVCVLGVVIFFGLQFLERGREKARKENEARFVALLNSSRSALDQNDFATALQKVGEALQLKPGSTNALALKTQAEQKLEAAYQGELKAARGALTEGAFDEAERLANRALQIRKDDKAATDLMKEAQTMRNQRLSQAEKDRNYTLALNSAQAAFDRGEYAKASTEADRAIGYRPTDNTAKKLKSDADAAHQKALAQLQQNRDYTNAVNVARAAIQTNDFPGAILQADMALKLRPGDETADKLKTDAQTRQQAAITQARRDRDYTNAVNAARTAIQAKDFSEALAQAEVALANRLNSPEAQKLKNDALAGQQNAAAQAERDRKYEQAMSAGQAALRSGNYSNAIAQADVALDNRPNNPEAQKLKTDAMAGQQSAVAQAQRNQQYTNAIAAAQAALGGNNYSNAIVQAELALTLRANDSDAQKLKDAAEAGQRNAIARAEQDRKYAEAMSAGQAALRSGNYSNAIAQAGVALDNRPNNPEAQKLKSDALAEQQKAVAQAERDRKYEQAMGAGQAALRAENYTNALTQAEVALNNRPDNPEAQKLKMLAEAGQAKVERAARLNKYQAIMAAATNGMQQAETATQRNAYDEALRSYDDALRKCEDASALQAGTEWQGFKTLLVGKRNQVVQQKDYSLASTQLNDGRYQEALDLCKKHDGQNFRELATKVQAEQAVYEKAKGQLEQCKYEFVNDAAVVSYKDKSNFKLLIDQAQKEAPVLQDLGRLRGSTNWLDLLKVWNDQGKATYLGKAPFRELYDWASQQQSAEAARNMEALKRVDANVEIYLVRFNLLSTRRATSPEAKRESPYGEISQAHKNQILTEVKGYRRQYEARSGLTDERKRNLDQLEKTIPGYFP